MNDTNNELYEANKVNLHLVIESYESTRVVTSRLAIILQTTPQEKTDQKLLFKCPHLRIPSTDSRGRTTFYSIIVRTTLCKQHHRKELSVEIAKLWDFLPATVPKVITTFYSVLKAPHDITSLQLSSEWSHFGI